MYSSLIAPLIYWNSSSWFIPFSFPHYLQSVSLLKAQQYHFKHQICENECLTQNEKFLLSKILPITSSPTQTVLYYYFYMYRTLAYPKFLCRLAHCGTGFNYVTRNFHRPLFNIIFQRKIPRRHRFYSVCRGFLQTFPLISNYTLLF